jgi:hypothetical protein
VLCFANRSSAAYWQREHNESARIDVPETLDIGDRRSSTMPPTWDYPARHMISFVCPAVLCGQRRLAVLVIGGGAGRCRPHNACSALC